MNLSIHLMQIWSVALLCYLLMDSWWNGLKQQQSDLHVSVILGFGLYLQQTVLHSSAHQCKVDNFNKIDFVITRIILHATFWPDSTWLLKGDTQTPHCHPDEDGFSFESTSSQSFFLREISLMIYHLWFAHW